MDLQFSQLLWHTRGKYWDYEFICIPKHIAGYEYLLMEDIVRSYSSKKYPVHFTGTIKRQRFVGILKHDEHLCDHASRAIEHLAIWFLPEGISSTWDKVPTSWFDQFYAKAQEVFNSNRIYGMTEDKKEELFREKIPLGRFLREEMIRKIDTVQSRLSR